MIMTALIGNRGCQLTCIHPAVDVHVHVELLWCVTQHKSEDSANGVGFPVAHDEFAFVVAHLAVGPGEETVVH